MKRFWGHRRSECVLPAWAAVLEMDGRERGGWRPCGAHAVLRSPSLWLGLQEAPRPGCPVERIVKSLPDVSWKSNRGVLRRRDVSERTKERLRCFVLSA